MGGVDLDGHRFPSLGADNDPSVAVPEPDADHLATEDEENAQAHEGGDTENELKWSRHGSLPASDLRLGDLE
jgi:hypothetical protein